MQKARAKIAKESEKSKIIEEALQDSRMTITVALITNVTEIVHLMIKTLFNEEITQIIGKRYEHGKKGRGIYRWGKNPGSVKLGNERIRIEVPRLRDEQNKSEVILESYQKLKEIEPDSEKLLKGVIHGISMQDYAEVARIFEDSYGMSRSSVSKTFIEQSSKRVEEFLNRDLSMKKFISVFVDGKYLAGEQMVIVVGITEEGEKIPLGFIQTTTENHRSIKELFSGLVERGFSYEEGILFVVDGSKGLIKAIKESFGDYAVIKRCSWHKRENILSHLPNNRKEEFKKKYNQAYSKTDYREAENAFIDISKELEIINISAKNSMLEGLDELLTLHRLGLIEDFNKSFSTTNVIESMNSQLVKYIGRVKNWKTSDQRFRWVASALIEIEPRLNKVINHNNLSKLKDIISSEVNNLISNKYLASS